MRWRPTAVALAAALLAGCETVPTDLADTGGIRAAISDGGHGGNAHFFFLPPMAPAATYGGVFDPAVEPTVDVCLLVGGACGPTVASFSTAPGSGSETIRVDLDDEHFIVNWHTGAGVTAGETYRVGVSVQGAELGFADVRVVASGRDLRGVDATEFVGLVAGRTLPIKFRIEEGAVPACEPEVLVDVNQLSLLVEAGRHGRDAQGFYQGTSVLFSGGLLYGTAPDEVVVGYDTRFATTEFAPAPVCVVQTGEVHRTVADLVVQEGVPAPPGITVRQETWAATDAANDDYVLLRFRFTNTGAVPVTNLHAAYVADIDLRFDINGPGGAGTDVALFNLAYQGAEAQESNAATFPQRVGVVPVLTAPVPLIVPRQYVGWASGFGGDPTSRADWWALVTGGVNTAPAGLPFGADIRQLVGFGPVTLGPGESVMMSFGLVGGANALAFTTNALNAQVRALTLGF